MRQYKIILFSLLIVILFDCTQKESKQWFELHTVSTDIPVGRRYGTPALADFDNDGDLDFAMSVTRGPVYWFEYLDGEQWEQHEIAEIPTGQLGGGAFDVDQDGWMDIVTGGYWFRNSQNPTSSSFEMYEYDTTIKTEIHDLVFADVNGDQNSDLVVLGDKEGCFWYDIPENPTDSAIWKKYVITMEVLDNRADIHGGFFPGGVGDVEMDGDMDVVLVGRWYRNEEKEQSWSRQFLPYGSAGYWGLSGRSWITDIDLDGDNDIVMAGGDQVDSRVAWLENNGKPSPRFKVHLLPLDAPGRRGSFHSLWVADFDNDGDEDIFTMDQEDPTILPTGAGTKAYLWENMDGKGANFKEHVVLDENIGGHDVKFGDADGDGDLDAYFKVWSAYSENAYGGKPHVNYLENKSK